MRSPFDLSSEKHPRSLGWAPAGLALLCGLGACSGDVLDAVRPPIGGSGGEGPGGAGGRDPAMAPVDPGTKGIHRLNSNEYNATVADVLRTTLQPAHSGWQSGEIGAFDNIAAVLDVDEAQYQRYFEAAGLIAADVFAHPAQK